MSPSARAPSRFEVCEKDGQTMSTTKTKSQNASARKRILSVTIRRMIDDSPDASYLGEYGNRPKTEYAIDRAHSEDCTANNPTSKDGISWLDRIEEQIRTGDIGEDSNYLT